jgi:hypothetical protein
MALNLNFKNSPLPNPPAQFDAQYVRQMIRVLEIYFDQLDAWNLQVYNALTSNNGGQIVFPYFSGYQNGNTALTGNITNVSTTPIPVTSTTGFESSGFIIIENEIIQYTGKTTTTFTGITRGVKSTTNVAHNTGAAVSEAAGVTAGSSASAKIDNVVSSHQITCTPPDSKVYFSKPAVYNIQFSMQLLNYSNAEDNVTVWFKKNNIDIPESSSIEQVNAKHGSSPGATIMALNYVDEFAAGDYFELYWASDSGNTVLATYPPGTSPVHPASPSMILTVTYASAIP